MGGREGSRSEERERVAWKEVKVHKEGYTIEEKVTAKLLCSIKCSSANSQRVIIMFVERCKRQETLFLSTVHFR